MWGPTTNPLSGYPARVGGGSDSTASRSQSERQKGQAKRVEIISSIMLRVLGSKLALLMWLLLVTITLTCLVPYCWLTLSAPLALMAWQGKVLLFDLLMVKGMIEHVLGLWKWFDLVDDNLYLGAVPMQPTDATIVVKKLQVNAVLTVMEPYELACPSISGKPVQEEEWRRLEVKFLLVPCSDFVLPSLDALHKGADFLNNELSEGRRAYVHCRNGRSRGALFVLAYFVKHKRLSTKEAFVSLVAKRPLCFYFNSTWMKRLEQFESTFRSSKPNSL